jgi:hypothetical protein
MAIVVALLCGAGTASAAQYPAYSDTGWGYASKRDCCNDAIAAANNNSGEACVASGGVPSPFRGSQRGSCTWDWMQDTDGYMLYRCYGEAAVWCR